MASNQGVKLELDAPSRRMPHFLSLAVPYRNRTVVSISFRHLTREGIRLVNFNFEIPISQKAKKTSKSLPARHDEYSQIIPYYHPSREIDRNIEKNGQQHHFSIITHIIFHRIRHVESDTRSRNQNHIWQGEGNSYPILLSNR